MELRVEWLGRVEYRRAWALQHELVAARSTGDVQDTLLLLEHPAVLTLGRRGNRDHVLAETSELARRGIEVIEVERGGEVTYHGPGQLVAYPILAIAERGLLIRSLVRALEAAMSDTAATWGVATTRREGDPGTWIERAGTSPRKLGAVGLRIERGVSYHGIGLNVTTDLRDFALIDPCGFVGLDVTSIAREAGWTGAAAQPSLDSVAEAARRFATAFETRIAEAAGVRVRAADAAVGGRAPAAVPV
jgi:lipoyl(octanoyl) transferase